MNGPKQHLKTNLREECRRQCSQTSPVSQVLERLFLVTKMTIEVKKKANILLAKKTS